MKLETMRDLFLNDSARDEYLREMEAKVTKALDLETVSDPETKIDSVVITLFAVWLRQTPDTPQERQKLIDRASHQVKSLIAVKGITRLRGDGIKFEAGRRIPDIDLVGSVRY